MKAMRFSRKSFIACGVSVLLFASGILVGLLGFAPEKFSPEDFLEERTGGYTFINPLRECNIPERYFSYLRPFQEKINSRVRSITEQKAGVDYISVYFRALNNGPWFGVDADQVFSPASLLKVPIMITYFKQAETDPAILSKTYVLEEDESVPNIEQLTQPSERIERGKPYSVLELIRRMIVYSDNMAQHVLVRHIDEATLRSVYSDFDLRIPDQDHPETFISVRAYASFFRVLFNASYLSKEHSEQALRFLSQSEYSDGLVAGVPAGTVIAHKFGERARVGISDRQLHDCGIVYYPEYPYLLCVMTRGADNRVLSRAIQEISRVVYEEVSSQLSK